MNKQELQQWLDYNVKEGCIREEQAIYLVKNNKWDVIQAWFNSSEDRYNNMDGINMTYEMSGN